MDFFWPKNLFFLLKKCKIALNKNFNEMDENKTLVVIDVQNDFIDGALKNEEAINKVKNIVERIDNFDGSVIIYTQDTHGEYYLDTDEGKNLPVVHCVYKSDGWEINKDVNEAFNRASKRGVKLINVFKNTFGSEFFFEYFKKEGVDNSIIDIVGFCTDICVVSNALIIKAAVANCNNVTLNVFENCCAGTTIENHNSALNVMKSCQINII